MSTVLEVIAARHIGMDCLAISMVSNHAAGLHEGTLDHTEVIEAGKEAAAGLGRLISSLVSDWLSN